MPTPIGHTLFGLALFKLTPVGETKNDFISILLVIFAANAPDLDFVPGILVGDFNRYHQLYSHSIVFVVGFALLVFLICFSRPAQRLRFGLTAGALYASHLLLDLISYDGAEPIGMPLLWPFSSQLFHSPYTIFGGLLHGHAGDNFTTALQDIFQAANLKVIGVEIAVTLPFLMIVIFTSRRRKYKIFKASQKLNT